MAARVFTIYFDAVHNIRPSQWRRAFHVTIKQQYARAVKRRSSFLQNLQRNNVANVLPQEPPRQSNRFDYVRGIMEPLNDNCHFEYDAMCHIR